MPFAARFKPRRKDARNGSNLRVQIRKDGLVRPRTFVAPLSASQGLVWGDMSSKPADAEPDRLLILAARTVIVLHRELERAARGTDITIAQYRFLLSLKRGASRARDLAQESAIGKPAASALINELGKRGLVVREADPRDGRSEILRLTPAGVAKHAAFERELARVLGEFMPPDESRAMLEAISELAYRIDRRSERPIKG